MIVIWASGLEDRFALAVSYFGVRRSHSPLFDIFAVL